MSFLSISLEERNIDFLSILEIDSFLIFFSLDSLDNLYDLLFDTESLFTDNFLSEYFSSSVTLLSDLLLDFV